MKCLLLLMLGACATAPKGPTREERIARFEQFHAEVQESSFRTGCVGGFLAVYELGMYVRPKRYQTPKQAFGDFMAECDKKAAMYRLEQATMRHQSLKDAGEVK
jgi:hypothetical protein